MLSLSAAGGRPARLRPARRRSFLPGRNSHPMATRDLTDHFIRQRSALHRKVGGNFGGGGDGVGGTGLLDSSGGAQIDTSALSVSGASPVYVETVNELQADFQGIATRCE